MEREFEAALRTGDVRAIELCFARGCSANSLDRYGQTPLMLAVMSGSLDAVKLVLGRGPDLDRTTKFRLTALMLAVVRGEANIAKELINAGADRSLEGTGPPGFSNKTALDLARDRNEKELIELLDISDPGRLPEL